MRRPSARCTLRPIRSPFTCCGRCPRILPLEAAVVLGEPQAIAASFLRHAHAATVCGGYTNRGNQRLARDSNSASACLQRTLSCDLSRDVVLSACTAAVTPAELLPPPVQRCLQAQTVSRDVAFAQPEWRPFFFSLIRSIHSTRELHESPSLALLCAICLAPSVRLGERLARVYCGVGGDGSDLGRESTRADGGNHGVVGLTGGDLSDGQTICDGVVAFGACCAMNPKEERETRDAAWMRLWADVQSVLPTEPNDGLREPEESWVRCQELLLACLMRSGRHEEIRTVLSPDGLVAKQLHRMSDNTLAQLLVQPLLCDATRFLIFRALLDVSRAKAEAAVALRRSPFSRNDKLPSVARSTRVFAAALRCLVSAARDSPSPSNNLRLFVDVEALCRICNRHALAQSLLPSPSEDGGGNDSTDRAGTIAAHMKAAFDSHRAHRLTEFVSSLTDAVELARGFARRGDDLASAMVHACVSLLSGLLTLCAPCRAKDGKRSGKHGAVGSAGQAQPAWRRRLELNAAVRSHKYELLPGELPHGVLSCFIAMLLADGFVDAGGALGADLAVADFVDLNYYSLQLLGSLYHATRVIKRDETPGDAVAIVESLYRRRRQVFGEDGAGPLRARKEITAPPSEETGGRPQKNSCVRTALLGLQVVRETPDLGSTATDIDFFRGRSVFAAGGAFAVDGSVGVWLRKATVQVRV